MLYEMRVYHCVPGRLPALHARFENATLKLWKKHGIRQVGFFTDVIGDNCNNKLTYFLRWKDLAEREQRWNAFASDPAWIAARTASELDGPIIARVENAILGPTAYSKLSRGDARSLGENRAVKIVRLESFLANCGLRNYLFVRLHTDKGLSGVGEATLEWQEQAVHTLLHEWAEERILGVCPFDIEEVFGNLIRDQYQGGATVMTVISALEIACWDLIGKACGQPVYRLLGGRAQAQLQAYANGWYGGAVTPQDYADKARAVVARGYTAMKFDPFGQAWKDMDEAQMRAAEDIVAAVREAVGDATALMIEVHGRLSVGCAIEMGRRLAPYRPAWYEEPVSPHNLDLLAETKRALPFPVAAGERLYMLEDFARLATLRACDVVQPDLAHCGGLWMGKKIAALCQPQDMRLAPHCSIGPVALCAAVHFGWATPQVLVQENFGDFDAPWRSALVGGWQPMRDGRYVLPDQPGLGIALDDAVCAQHPFVQHTFPSLWDQRWIARFTQSGTADPAARGTA